MGSLCTDEGDKFGLHSSLLAQLKTGFGASGLFVYFLLDTSMMAFHLWSFQLSFLASVMKMLFARPMRSTPIRRFLSECVCVYVCVCVVRE